MSKIDQETEGIINAIESELSFLKACDSSVYQPNSKYKLFQEFAKAYGHHLDAGNSSSALKGTHLSDLLKRRSDDKRAGIKHLVDELIPMWDEWWYAWEHRDGR